MDTSVIIAAYLSFSLLAATMAWMKNRSFIMWFLASLFISPVVCVIILLFLKSIEKFQYTGPASINNEAYKVYLTKQYHIEKIETTNKFSCHGTYFDDAISALRYAQRLDRGIIVEVLEKEDPIIGEGEQSHNNDKAVTADPAQPNVKGQNKFPNGSVPSMQGTVTKKSPAGAIAITLLLIAGIGFPLWLLNYSQANSDMSTTSLESAPADTDLLVDGELAEAFNLNSKYTDLQRDNILKKIKGKVVEWTVEVYEIKKGSASVYELQTAGGVNIGKSDVGLFIHIVARNKTEEEFIEKLKTGDRVMIKGVLTGDSFLRSLLVKPAILKFAESRNKTDSASVDVDSVTRSKQDSAQAEKRKLAEMCYEKWYQVARSEAVAEQEKAGNKGPYDESELVPMGLRKIAELDCEV